MKTILLALALLLILGQAAMAAEPSIAPNEPITPEQALSIALAQAELTPEDVLVTKVESELDDGLLVFDVEFYAGFTEYECEIDALSGRILEWDVDIDD